MRTTFPLFVLLASFAAAAQDAGKRPTADAGRPTADAGIPAGPRAALVFAKDLATLQKWGKTKPEARAALPTITVAKVSERLFVGLFLDAYELPQSRRVDLSADVAITDCTGRLFYEKALSSYARTTDPKTDTAVFLKPHLELVFGLTDPECAYSVKLTVYDTVRGTNVSTVSTFTLTR